LEQIFLLELDEILSLEQIMQELDLKIFFQHFLEMLDEEEVNDFPLILKTFFEDELFLKNQEIKNQEVLIFIKKSHKKKKILM
jgi:hypothetical protein